MQILLIITYLLSTTSGVILLNLGGNPGNIEITNSNMNFNISWISFIGLICYVISFVLFTRIITTNEVSFILPICMGLVQVLTLISAYFVLHERIGFYGFLGAALVIMGIVIMNISGDR